MDSLNRRSAMAVGAAALAGIVASSLTPQPASAQEHRSRRLDDAYEALRNAREEIQSAGHDYGGRKREALEAIDTAMRRIDELRSWHR